MQAVEQVAHVVLRIETSILAELYLDFRLLLLRALEILLALCTSLLPCNHAIGGALPLRCEAKLPLRVRVDLPAAPRLGGVPRPGPRMSVPRSLSGGLAQQPSCVARLLALLCTLLQSLSLRSLTALRHEGIVVLDDVVT